MGTRQNTKYDINILKDNPNKISPFDHDKIGPHLITRLRNWNVHATKSHIEKADSINKNDLLMINRLSIWYLELVILKVMNYSGLYYSRFKGGFANPEKLPQNIKIT